MTDEPLLVTRHCSIINLSKLSDFFGIEFTNISDSSVKGNNERSSAHIYDVSSTVGDINCHVVLGQGCMGITSQAVS